MSIAVRHRTYRLAEHMDWLITVELSITFSGLLSFPLNASVLRAFVHRSPWTAPAELALWLLVLMRAGVERSDDHYVTRLKRSSGWRWMPQILQLSTGRLHVDELSVHEAAQCMLVINRRWRKLPSTIVLNGMSLLASLNLLYLMGSSYANIVAVTAWCVGAASLIVIAIVVSLLCRRAGRLISAPSLEL